MAGGSAIYTDEAIKLLNEKFVCFAPGWFINSKDEIYEAAWKRFYLAKQLPTEGKGWLNGSMLVLMTSNGRLLSGSMKYGDRGSLVQALREVLAEYAKLPKEERVSLTPPTAEKPAPAPPPGGLVLTIYDRPLGYGDGQYRLPQGRDLGGLRTHAPSGQRSSVWLTKEECKSLIPMQPERGQTQQVPAKLAKRICLYGLWPQTFWVVEHSWQPDAFREGAMQVTVAEVSDKELRLRIHGSVILASKARLRIYPTGNFAKDVENRYDARLEGTIVYDRAKESIVQFDMVALGDYAGAMFTYREEDGKRLGEDQWREATPAAPAPLAFAFEMDRSAYEVPPERRRPRSFVHAYIFRDREQYYWDPDKWEEDWRKRQGR